MGHPVHSRMHAIQVAMLTPVSLSKNHNVRNYESCGLQTIDILLIHLRFRSLVKPAFYSRFKHTHPVIPVLILLFSMTDIVSSIFGRPYLIRSRLCNRLASVYLSICRRRCLSVCG